MSHSKHWTLFVSLKLAAALVFSWPSGNIPRFKLLSMAAASRAQDMFLIMDILMTKNASYITVAVVTDRDSAQCALYEGRCCLT